LPHPSAGSAAAISETSSELGGALGIAILGSIGTAVYRSQVADAVPAGVPPAETETAKDTLGGAVETAETLPGEVGAGLLDAAREAFVQGMQVAALTSAVIAAATAVVTVLFLHQVGTGSEEDSTALEPASTRTTSGP
jgi:DHA2 family multidrug resistance protein-like MFS transporter